MNKKAAPKKAPEMPKNDFTKLTPVVPEAVLGTPLKTTKAAKKLKAKKLSQSTVIDADLASLMNLK